MSKGCNQVIPPFYGPNPTYYSSIISTKPSRLFPHSIVQTPTNLSKWFEGFMHSIGWSPNRFLKMISLIDTKSLVALLGDNPTLDAVIPNSIGSFKHHDQFNICCSLSLLMEVRWISIIFKYYLFYGYVDAFFFLVCIYINAFFSLI